MAGTPDYVSRVRIERLGGPQRLARLPAEDEPIAFSYRLRVPDERRQDAQRVHGFHARFCPVPPGLEDGIEVRTELELVS